jgi:hypothetical protein
MSPITVEEALSMRERIATLTAQRDALREALFLLFVPSLPYAQWSEAEHKAYKVLEDTKP